MDANDLPHTPILSPPPKRSTDSLQAELDYKERRLKLLERGPGQLADYSRFVGPESEATTKEELTQDVRRLRDQLLVKRQQEQDARIHAEGMKWLKEHESPSLPLHARPAPAPVASPPAITTHSTPATLEPATEPKSNDPFDFLHSSDQLAPDQDTRLSEDSWSMPDEDLFNFYENSLESIPDMNPSPQESSGSMSSPEQVASLTSPSTSTNNRKRPRESLSSPVGHISKSMRPTPSPALTRSTSHSSLDFDLGDLADTEDFRRLVGGDIREDMREIRRDQKLQEKALLQKKAQEESDAKFARELELSLQGDDGLEPLWGSSQAGPSSLSRNTSQAILDSNGRFRRPPPPSSPPPPPLFNSSPPKNNYPIKKEDRISIFDSSPVAKDQKPFVSGRPTAIPSNVDFIDLASDDDDENVVFNTDWPTGYRQPNSKRELPWLKNEGTTYSNYGLSGVPPYQNQPSTYNSLTGPVANAWDAMQNAAQSVYNTGQALFNPFSNGAGLGSYAGIGTGSDPITLADSDFYPGMSGNSIADSALAAHGLNPYNPANQGLVDQYRERVDYLIHDPTRTTAEIKSLLENIRPDEDLPEKDREGTPEAMKYGLMNHQMLGLAWMRKMEEGSNKGGILADDMGLGKTIQALALMVSRRSTNPARKTTLIVAPVALLKQWEKEIRTKLKPDLEHQMTTYIFHGSKKKVTWEHLRTFDVVLTTFGTLANELKRKEGLDMRKRENTNWRPTSNADRLPLLGDECKWYRVIIDEAQCIKNKSTKASLAASHLQALTRFCMSGTPMMNNVGELYPLIRFLRIKPYSSAEKFSHDFTNPLKKGTGEGADKAMRMLQALLKAILLRRTKKSKIDGKPIIDLLERTTVSQHANFSEDEHAFYKAVESQTQLQFNKYLKAGTVGRNYSNVLVLLLRLRQACCHPHLIKDFGQAGGPSDLSSEEMVKLAKQLAPDVVARIIESTGTEKPHGTECPICMDMTPNASIITPCGHSTCSECFAKISDPSQAIANGDGEGTSNAIKCPNCRGQIVLTKVINHNAFKEAHMPELLDELAAVGLDDADESTDDSDSDSDDSEDDADSDGDLKDFVVDDDEEILTTTDEEEETDGYRQGKTPFDKAMSKPKPKSKKSKGKGKANPRKEPRKTLAQLKREGQSNAKSRKKYIARLKKEYVPSSKIDKTLEILQGIMDSSEGEKTIIFSQFTSLLDLLEIPILAKGWDFKRYDGSMSSQARNEAVEMFTDRPNCRIMLVSLKAGNAGLNLVAASQVIILDPFWNPYIEEQAIDRAHRIGQLRPVRVHRILVPETVEDRILALQEQKRAIIEGALDEKASARVGRLDTRQLAYLFGVPG